MARRSKSKALADLEGKLGGIRREVLKVLGNLKREITKRGEELAGLKAEYAKGEALLRGRTKLPHAPVRRRARRARQVNWKEVFGSLPARFTLRMLAHHPVAGRRPKAHLYAILSRWKKEGVLVRDPAGGYHKVTARPTLKRGGHRAKPAPIPKPARIQKPTSPSEAQTA